MDERTPARTADLWAPEASDPARWWESAVVYEIVPISFQVSDGDGWGDLAGYLAWLGGDAVWLTPICPSSMRDLGYDISDFCAVDSRFGTLEQFDALVAALHARGIRLVLDFVPNHTADDHPWFVESRGWRPNARTGMSGSTPA